MRLPGGETLGLISDHPKAETIKSPYRFRR